MLQEIVLQLRSKQNGKKVWKTWTLDPEGRTPPFRRLTCLLVINVNMFKLYIRELRLKYWNNILNLIYEYIHFDV